MDEAIADFGRAISTNPGNKDFLQARASAFAANGSYAAAETDFNAALALDPLDAVAYVGRAEARLKLGATAESLDDANRALLVDPSLASAYAARADVDAASGQSDKAAADRQAADNALGAAEKSRQAAAAVWAHPHLRVTVSGTFPTSPPTLKRTFMLDSAIEVRDDVVTYQTPGLGPYKIASGEKIEEKFSGTCNGVNNRPVSDQGLRAVLAIVNEYLIQVELQSRIDFHGAGCAGRYNSYKESFLVDLSNGGCKFSYRQDRDLFNVGAFDNRIYDQPCVVEPLKWCAARNAPDAARRRC
jgi:tetratricopeptide (TPR) repeat protein